MIIRSGRLSSQAFSVSMTAFTECSIGLDESYSIRMSGEMPRGGHDYLHVALVRAMYRGIVQVDLD